MANTNSIFRDIEEAAVRPGQWPAVLNRLVALSRATWGGLITQETGLSSARIEWLVGLDRPSQKEYESYYFKVSPLNTYSALFPVGEVFADHMLPDYRTYARSEAHNDFFAPRAGHHLLTTNLWLDKNTQSYICFRRSARAGQFSEEEIDWLRILAPHLASAVRVHGLLETERRKTAALIQTLDHLPVGVLLADAAGRIVAANERAESYLANAERRRAGDSELRSPGPALTETLRRAMAAFNGAHPGTVLKLPRGPDMPPLELLLFPVAPQTGEIFDVGARQVAVIVFLLDPVASGDIAPAALASLYGLTPAEARLASGLVASGSLMGAAESIGITEQTARSTIKRVYAKTAVKGQADLVRLVLSGFARFASG